MKLKQKMKKLSKIIQTFKNERTKSYRKMFANIAKLFTLACGMVACISCSSTKVSVSKPLQGTTTTITVTTNNPVTTETNVNPTTTLNK